MEKRFESLFHNIEALTDAKLSNLSSHELIKQKDDLEAYAEIARNLLLTSRPELSPENIQCMEEIVRKSSDVIHRIDNIRR